MGYTWHNEREDIWNRINMRSNNCWIWMGSVSRQRGGYGQFMARGKGYLAHRLVYELCFGNIPDDLVVRHLCNNPLCCRPDHLELGTHQDNTNDMLRAQRQARGSRQGNAILDEKHIPEIIKLWNSGKFTQGDIGRMFGVNSRTISRIIVGKGWIHVTVPR